MEWVYLVLCTYLKLTIQTEYFYWPLSRKHSVLSICVSSTFWWITQVINFRYHNKNLKIVECLEDILEPTVPLHGYTCINGNHLFLIWCSMYSISSKCDGCQRKSSTESQLLRAIIIEAVNYGTYCWKQFNTSFNI